MTQKTEEPGFVQNRTFMYRAPYAKRTSAIPFPEKIIDAAVALAKKSTTFPNSFPLRNNIIDDETLGLNWATEKLEYLRGLLNQSGNEIKDESQIIYTLKNNIESLRDLALLKWIGSINPEDDTIEWVKSKVEAFAEWYSEVNAFTEWYVDKYCPANTSLQLSAIQKHLIEMLRVKDNTSRELRAKIDVLADFLLKEMPDKIINEGACKTAIQIITELSTEHDDLAEFLLTVIPDQHLDDYVGMPQNEIIKKIIKTDKAHIKLKDGALDDAMKQFKEATHKANENADLLTQAGERMAVLNPNPGNFDQLLKIVLAYVVNTPQLVTVSQTQLLKAIGMINI